MMKSVIASALALVAISQPLFAAEWLDIGQDAYRHEWILQHDVGNVPPADVIDIGAGVFEAARSLPQYGQFGVAEKDNPAFQILQRLIKH